MNKKQIIKTASNDDGLVINMRSVKHDPNVVKEGLHPKQPQFRIELRTKGGHRVLFPPASRTMTDKVFKELCAAFNMSKLVKQEEKIEIPPYKDGNHVATHFLYFGG